MTKFKNLLVLIDSRAESLPVLEYALQLAKAWGAALRVADVVPDLSWAARLLAGGSSRVIEQLTEDKNRRLQAVIEGLRGEGVAITGKLLNGPSSDAIIGEAIAGKHDLVIAGAKGPGSRRAGFFGTTALRLLRKCPCPVMITKPGHLGNYERVVAAVDSSSPDAEHVRLNDRILELAMVFSSEPQVVHIWSVYGASILKEHMRDDEFADLMEKTETRARRKLDDLLTKHGMGVGRPNAHLLGGDAGSVIPEFVSEQQADLLVLGTVARSGVAGFLIGNTAEQILNRVECSVLAIKPIA